MRALVLAALAAATVMAQIPAGRTVQVRIGQTISSATAKSGDTWSGTLAQNVTAGGKVVARRGSAVTGTVATAKSSGRLSDPGVLTLRVTRIGTLSVNTSLASYKGKSHTKRNTTAIGGGAAAGAVIGAIAGGGKGAAIGAAAGAGAGTAGAAATGKKDVEIPVEAVMSFTLR